MGAFQDAYDLLKSKSVILPQEPGQYRLSFTHDPLAVEYVTDDLADALREGLKIAPHAPPPPLPPLGPTGRKKSRRGQMLAHNRKIAARRRRQAAKGQT